MNFTDAERRDVALFVRDVWRHERKRRRCRPAPHETLIAAYAAADAIVAAEVGNTFRYLGAPHGPRSCLSTLTSAVTKMSARLGDQAALVLEYLDAAGDRPGAKPESVEIDRRIIRTMARDYHRTYHFNDSAVGKQLGLSHTSIRDRRVARAARVMSRLHADAPSLWSGKGRPVDEKLVAPLPLAA